MEPGGERRGTLTASSETERIAPVPQPGHPSHRLTGRDYAGMLSGLLFTLGVTVINSRGRLLWEDELLGWVLLRDPSWTHMIHAWNLGADGGGFSFYLFGRLWFAIVGASPLTFRLLSGLCFGLAFAVTWAALRRLYPTWVVALAVINTWFFSPPFTQHIIEGRFYGQLILATSLAVWLVLILDEPSPSTDASIGNTSRVPLRLYLAAFGTHALLTTTHVLGVAFSGFLLLATIALDVTARRRRIGLYFTIAASWLLLLPERASLQAAAAVGKPHFWTKAPNLRQAIGPYTGYSSEILAVLLALVLLAGVNLRRRPGTLRKAIQSRRAAYFAAAALFCAPLAFTVLGVRGTWLFNDRYLLPVTVGVAILSAELLQLATLNGQFFISAEAELAPGKFLGHPQRRSALWIPTIGLYAAFLLFWDFHHVARFTPTHPDYTAQLAPHLPANLPAVAEDAFTFTELLQNPATARSATFLLDWPWALAPQSPRVEVTQYHLMQNWRKAGYFAGHIQNAESFLAQTPRFVVIHAGPPGAELAPPEIGNPLAARLAQNPAFQVRKLYTLDRLNHDAARDTVWLICRKTCQ